MVGTLVSCVAVAVILDLGLQYSLDWRYALCDR